MVERMSSPIAMPGSLLRLLLIREVWWGFGVFIPVRDRKILVGICED